MYKGKKILAVIPARGGSKRLPGKNIKLLANKPLIAWTIEASFQAALFDEVMVNTDEQVIADVAKLYGASIPFLRDSNLATDTASSLDVVIETIEYYRKQGKKFDFVALLQPTSPLRDCDDITNCVDLLIQNKAASVLTVCEVDHPIQWCNTLDTERSMASFIKDEYKNKRSQEFETYYRLNGAVYVWDVDMLMENKSVIVEPSFANIMQRDHSVDIDKEIDFIVAEALMKKSDSSINTESNCGEDK